MEKVDKYIQILKIFRFFSLCFLCHSMLSFWLQEKFFVHNHIRIAPKDQKPWEEEEMVWMWLFHFTFKPQLSKVSNYISDSVSLTKWQPASGQLFIKTQFYSVLDKEKTPLLRDKTVYHKINK